MNEMNQTAENYIRAVEKELGTKEKQVLTDFITLVKDYYTEHPDCTEQDLIEMFGMPESVAEQYQEAFPEKIKQRKKRKRWITIFCIIVLATLAVGLGYYVVDTFYHSIGGYATETIIIHDGSAAPDIDTNNIAP